MADPEKPVIVIMKQQSEDRNYLKDRFEFYPRSLGLDNNPFS